MNVDPITLEPNVDPVACVASGASEEVHTLTGLFQRLNLQLLASTVRHGVERSYAWVREFGVVDNSLVLLMKSVNAVTGPCYKLFNDESLKTLKQKEREEESKRMRLALGTESVCPPFCEMTARLIEEVVQHKVAEKLEGVPGAVEAYAHYKMRVSLPFGLGWGGDYVYWQVDRRTGCRNALSDSRVGRALQRWYCAIRTYVAHKALGKPNMDVFLNFEHMLLKACCELGEAQKKALEEAKSLSLAGKPATNKTVAFALQSLAAIMARQSEFEAYLEGMKKAGPLHYDDAVILSLDWHKKHNMLPKGLPDPAKVRLTAANLAECLRAALHAYVSEEVVERMLASKVSPKGLSGILYFLELKDLLKEIATAGAIEGVLEQLLNPDLFALAVLTGAGVETMELEPDKFGLKTRDMVLKVGRKILRASFDSRSDSASLIHIFEKSELKNGPGNAEGIIQRQNAKAQLQVLIAGMIRRVFDKSDKQASGNTFRDTLHQLPAVGTVTRGVNFLINGAIYTWQYFANEAQKGDVTFLGWMTTNLSGDPLFNHLAERIITLIYHPSWRVILLQLIDAVVQSVAGERDGGESEEEMRANFKVIASFLFAHVAPDSLRSEVGAVATYFTGDKAFDAFKVQVDKPAETSFVERGVPFLMPTIKEYLLFVRLTESFRMQGVHFEGDAKFWECYVREYLNQCVLASQPPDNALKVSPMRAGVDEQLREQNVREKKVDELLSLSLPELRALLAKIVPRSAPSVAAAGSAVEVSQVGAGAKRRIRLVRPREAPVVVKGSFDGVVIDEDYQGSQEKKGDN